MVTAVQQKYSLTGRCSDSTNLCQGKASNLNRKWSRILIQISGLIRIWIHMSPDRSQNVVDSLRCQHQSFRWVSWKSVGDCIRNANKSKIPYSALVGEVKNDPVSVSSIRSTPKSESVLPIDRPIIAPSFNEIGWLLLSVILLTERMNDRQTAAITHLPPRLFVWLMFNDTPAHRRLYHVIYSKNC